MKYIICIDDTDNLKSFSTGIVADNLSKVLSESLNCSTSPVVRHQLLLDDRIKYTSHNSAMSFELESIEEIYKSLIDISICYIKDNHAEGSDPGLCIVPSDTLGNGDLLIEFGYRAKKEVLTMDEAYSLSEKLNIHLSAHGGTGEGVIGALAGAGLRLSGNDGKFRKTIDIDLNGEEMSAATLINYTKVDCICDISGNVIDENASIFIRDRIKKIIKDSKTILLVKKVEINNEEIWTNYTVQELKDLNL